MKKIKKLDEKTIELWKKDSNNWALGLFYFNKNDKRIFVSKRISIFGSTFNFANPISSLILLVLITLIYLHANK